MTDLSTWLAKAGGPFIGPKGGKYADAAHKIPWQESSGKDPDGPPVYEYKHAKRHTDRMDEKLRAQKDLGIDDGPSHVMVAEAHDKAAARADTPETRAHHEARAKTLREEGEAADKRIADKKVSDAADLKARREARRAQFNQESPVQKSADLSSWLAKSMSSVVEGSSSQGSTMSSMAKADDEDGDDKKPPFDAKPKADDDKKPEAKADDDKGGKNETVEVKVEVSPDGKAKGEPMAKAEDESEEGDPEDDPDYDPNADDGDDEGDEDGEPMEKADGEGTRGGKVIGHTSSGKPIYESSHANYKGAHSIKGAKVAKRFPGHTAKDHEEAASAHRKAAKELQTQHTAKINEAHKRAGNEGLVSQMAGNISGGGHKTFSADENREIGDMGRTMDAHRGAAYAHDAAAKNRKLSEARGPKSEGDMQKGLGAWLQKSGYEMPKGQPSLPQVDAQGMSPKELAGLGASGAKASGKQGSDGTGTVDSGKKDENIDDANDALPLAEGTPGISTTTMKKGLGLPMRAHGHLSGYDEGYELRKAQTIAALRAGATDITIAPGKRSEPLAKSQSLGIPAPSYQSVDDGSIAVMGDHSDRAIEIFQKSEAIGRMPTHMLPSQSPLLKSAACPACSEALGVWLSMCPSCGYRRP